ncbi:hypothetical protein BSY15_1838 [Acidovorax sp. RAC01]|nr:hypothetical protein BSY15_1838 [Acidovorax sp. RAC01]
MRVTFFRVAERKSPKKGRPHCLRPLRFAPGQPVVLAGGVRRRTRCAALQLRSNSCGESVHEARVSFGTRATPPAALLGAHRGDGERTSIRAIASLGPISRVQCLTQPTAASTGRGPAGSSAAMTRMAVRLFGCSAVRLFGCSAVRLFGCSAVRLFGCSAVRLFGCSAPYPFWLRLRRGGCGVARASERACFVN